MKKLLYILIGLAGILLGIIGAFTHVLLPVGIIAAVSMGVLILLDYQRVTYLLAFYIIIDFILRYVMQVPFLGGNWDELLFVVCVMLWFYKWLVYRKQKAYFWTPLEFPLIFFIGVGILLLLVNSPDMRIGLEGFRAVFEYLLWFFVTVQLLRTPTGAKRLVYMLVFVGGLLGLDGVHQYIVGVEMPGNWVDKAEVAVRTRVFSIAGNPNALASLMVLLTPLSISLVFFEKKLGKKVLFGAIALIMLACLVFTFTRAAWIGFIFALIVYVFVKNRRMLIPALAGMAVGGVIISFLVPSVADRIAYLISPEYMVSSSKGGRVKRWIEGLYMLKQNPLFGMGLGRFGGAVAVNNKIPGAFYMDNYYVKTAVETGIVGLSAFLVLIYNLVIWNIRAIRNLKNTRYVNIAHGAFAGMCGVLVHSAAENVFEVPMMAVYFWVMAGIVMFLAYMNNKGTLKESDAV
ncbi:MAG: O-antigen ligase family protein [Clostridia bacterium]|nr:O-antigen ligase family protein [Clostridia bacterium]